MRIGYSFWGFLGEGIVDTPDGGRGHRRVWLQEFLRRGNSLTLLQKNRDLLEAADHSLELEFEWASDELPEIDLLFLEWRWEIPGRNIGIECGDPAHTCDFHRQQDLLHHYTYTRKIPTIIWDKDLRIAPNADIRNLPNVQIAESAWFPRADAIRLQIPVSSEVLASAKVEFKTGDPRQRTTSLVYVGNQYGRDGRFNDFFAIPAITESRHLVVGKWPNTSRWPWVRFTGRHGFTASMRSYLDARATVALLPPRYEAIGQTVQRIAESVTRGCVALVPQAVRGANYCTPPELIVANSNEVSARLQDIEGLSKAAYSALRLRSIDMLAPLQVDRQYNNLLDSCDWLSP